MTDALYGPSGFYRRPAGPAAHFRTSVHASPLFTEALFALALDVHRELDEPTGFAVVDVGAGRGELLRLLAEVAPADWRLVGVDLVGRPAGLPGRVEWVQGLEALSPVPYGLLVANEWLDNIPLDVLQDGRLLEVDDDGRERPGPLPSERDQQWIGRWAVLPDEPGKRTEIGWPRDHAWALATTKVEAGLAVAIDYAFDDRGPDGGTLTGYRDGRQVVPVPDGSCDLTAHVRLEACGQATGSSAFITHQRTALQALGVSATVPPRELASADPGDYLRRLARASEARELVDPDGLGRFGWLVQPLGLRPEPFEPLRRPVG